MTTEYKPYVGDVGTIIEIDMQETITGATAITFEVRKPKSGGGYEDVQWTGVTVEGTTKLKYTVGANNFDVAGIYIIQPKLTLSGWTGRGDPVQFTVYEHFKQ